MIRNKYLVSVLVAVYNVEAHIGKCLDSICNQTYRNLQIIVVDDGSTDNSGNICDLYKEKDSRIVVIHKSNGGLVSARKAGLEKAVGEYIGFVDGDDYIDPEMYMCLLEAIERANADISHCNFYNSTYYNDLSTKEVIPLDGDNAAIFLSNYIFRNNDCQKLHWGIVTKLFKKELIKESYKLVTDTQDYGEDLISFCLCVLAAQKMVVMDDEYYHYLIRDSSVSHKSNNIIGLIKLYAVLNNLLEKDDRYYKMSEAIEKFCKMQMASAIADNHGPFIQEYILSDIRPVTSHSIVIYGAGKIGGNYYFQLSCRQDCEIVAWVDRKASSIDRMGIKPISSERILDLKYDLILIAVMYKQTADGIKDELIKMGIEANKIIWIKPKSVF